MPRLSLASKMAGLYLHIPFCKQACYYCDFHFSVNTSIKSDLVRAIIQELEMQVHYLAGEPLETIYFGGGTPSLLTDTELNSILNTIAKLYPVAPNPEVTLEANPDDLTTGKLTALARAGINRLSIGVQSFDNQVLKFLNRAHTALEAERCIETARHIGIHNLSVDIMFGLPNQHEPVLKKDLARALALQPNHISVYSLTVEEKTVFGKWAQQGKLKITDEPEAARQFELVMDTLESNGLLQYEISNYAKPGFESRHNSSYWQRKKYLGIGPSAHSYNGDTRQFNVCNNHHYVKGLSTGKIPYEMEQLTPANKINEYIFTSLRTNAGCSLDVLKQEYGYNLLALSEKVLLRMVANHLITLTETNILLTRAGKLVADQVALEFFTSEK